MKILGIIVGNLPSMKNSRKFVINPRTGKPMVVKSDAANDFIKDAVRQITGDKRLGISENISLTAHVYYRNKKSDLDVELLCDLLQDVGVIENDNQIFEKHVYKHIDETNPHILWTIETIE